MECIKVCQNCIHYRKIASNIVTNKIIMYPIGKCLFTQIIIYDKEKIPCQLLWYNQIKNSD
jgi:hypothetical protein